MSFFPDDSMKSRLVYMHDRASDGTLSTRDHLMHLALVVQSPEEIKSCHKSGGGGLFAETGEFCSMSMPSPVLSTLKTTTFSKGE